MALSRKHATPPQRCAHVHHSGPPVTDDNCNYLAFKELRHHASSVPFSTICVDFSRQRSHLSGALRQKKRSEERAMTKSLSLVLFFVVLSALRAAMLVRASKQFVVGGSQGWREPAANDTALYSRWAAINRFQIGDSLYFRYTNDSVLLVDKKGYYHCNTNNPIAAFSDGKTVINLDRSGPFYFISSFDVHCNNGQRLIVEVMTPHQPPSPPQTSSPSPSPMPSAAVSPSLSAVTIFMATLGWSLLLSSNSVIFLAMANPTG